MNSVLTRPNAETVRFHLFSRSLHPELLEPLAVQQFRRDEYHLQLVLTTTGHYWSWTSPSGLQLSEMLAVQDFPLPQRGRVCRHRFEGEFSDSFRISPEIVYQTSLQREEQSSPVFRKIHEELLADGQNRGLIYHFHADQRFALAPLSLVTVDGCVDCLHINAFHTFPEEGIILKTMSMIETITKK
ncbi:MAG: DUF2617 family protein [Zavarzinella sp.]